MNMLRGDATGEQSGLLDSSLCKTINLDSWPYSQFDQDDHMAVACLYTLTQKLGDSLSREPGTIPDVKPRTGNARSCLRW
jgi:hypothetical protein